MSPRQASDPSATALFHLITSQRITTVIHVAVRLGVPQCLAGGARALPELSRETGADERSLGRLLRALVTLGLCERVDDERFSLTSMGSHLTDGARPSFAHWAILEAQIEARLWERLLDRVRTGRSPDGAAQFFAEMAPGPAKALYEGMVALTELVVPDLLAAWDFSGITRLIDVGGGQGHLLSAILRAYPSMLGTVFDLPRCAEAATRHLAEAGVGDRGDFVAGSFFARVPEGADALILKSVLHDWDDAESLRILDSCRNALPPSGKLLLVEGILPEDPGANPDRCSIALSDLNLLALGGGACERTEEEFRELLRVGGFGMTHVRSAGRYNVIEARVA
ncbi:MAG TPA: methyltransferase [Vicinamibacteria bacterium]|jgi:hypothetical protein|nr:methyltransferase [Vicinamibacteria bacterium]